MRSLPLSTQTLFLFLSLLTTFFFTPKTTLATTETTPEPVLDTSGQELQPGASYYILPSHGIGIGGGGLTFGTTTTTSQNDSCPHVVLQEPNDTMKGQPVQFLIFANKSTTPLNDDVVLTSTNLIVKFTNPSPGTTSCGESRVWKLRRFLRSAMIVGTNGAEGREEYGVLINMFKIEKVNNNNNNIYKLRFCASKGLACGDLGIYLCENKRFLRLAIVQMPEIHPLSVVFHKAHHADPVMIMSPHGATTPTNP
ncbi:kunitz trypsin inhibitor 2-like [Senna tora]|uniref:Kunitz trypsin inhibitor 2-like n=1 Tax=Senna tora TaxID=362788 RepID=A0A834SF51_9FABA|nr:kunitz trypsin inhibitor 2-like [Senna tora]